MSTFFLSPFLPFVASPLSLRARDLSSRGRQRRRENKTQRRLSTEESSFSFDRDYSIFIHRSSRFDARATLPRDTKRPDVGSDEDEPPGTGEFREFAKKETDERASTFTGYEDFGSADVPLP